MEGGGVDAVVRRFQSYYPTTRERSGRSTDPSSSRDSFAPAPSVRPGLGLCASRRWLLFFHFFSLLPFVENRHARARVGVISAVGYLVGSWARSEDASGRCYPLWPADSHPFSVYTNDPRRHIVTCHGRGIVERGDWKYRRRLDNVTYARHETQLGDPIVKPPPAHSNRGA